MEQSVHKKERVGEEGCERRACIRRGKVKGKLRRETKVVCIGRDRCVMQRREIGGNSLNNKERVGHGGEIGMEDLTLHKDFRQRKLGRHRE